MSNQEQSFAPGESRVDRRPINTDPREQRAPLAHPINTDPREQPQWSAIPPMGQPPRRRGYPLRWFAVSMLILVVIFGGLVAASFVLSHTITTPLKTFAVGAQPTLVVNASSADVTITSGPANQITAQASERVFLRGSDQLPVHYQQNGDTVTITVDQNDTFDFGLFYNSGVHLNVTVPSPTNLNVKTDSGNISATGINGQMILEASSGDISTNSGSGQVTLSADSGNIQASNISGQITLTTSSGDINASNASGQMTLRADSGNLSVQSASASGNSSFETSSGDIGYTGSLGPQGTYLFKADSGNVDLTLPGDAAMQVQASTDSGSIHSVFSGINIDGKAATGTAGSAPYAQVTIQTSSGDINLNRA